MDIAAIKQLINDFTKSEEPWELDDAMQLMINVADALEAIQNQYVLLSRSVVKESK